MLIVQAELAQRLHDLAPWMFVLAFVILVGGMRLQVRAPRTFIPVTLLASVVLSLAVVGWLDGVWLDVPGKWFLVSLCAFGLAAYMFCFSLASGPLMQSVERTLVYSGPDVPTLESDPLQVPVERLMWVGGPNVLPREVPRSRWFEHGARRAVAPVSSVDAARFLFARVRVIRTAVGSVWLLGLLGTAATNIPLWFAAAEIIVFCALSLIGVNQRRCVFGGLLGAERSVLHVLDEYAPRFIRTPSDITPTWRFRPGKTSWVGYTTSELGRRTLVMKAPRGGAPDSLPSIRRKQWMMLLFLGVQPRV